MKSDLGVLKKLINYNMDFDRDWYNNTFRARLLNAAPIVLI